MTDWENFFDLWLKTAACGWTEFAAIDEGNALSLRQLGDDSYKRPGDVNFSVGLGPWEDTISGRFLLRPA